VGEAASFFPTPEPVLQLLVRGDLILDPEFSLARELDRVLELVAKYADRPMDLADACLVRMSEMTLRCRMDGRPPRFLHLPSPRPAACSLRVPTWLTPRGLDFCSHRPAPAL
jgi:hypothetical protein